jgi:hypothetical protein
VVGNVGPRGVVQTCIIHLIRNTFGSNPDRDVIKHDSKPIYTAVNTEAARAALDELTEKWAPVRGHRPAVDERVGVTPFLAYLAVIACRNECTSSTRLSPTPTAGWAAYLQLADPSTGRVVVDVGRPTCTPKATCRGAACAGAARPWAAAMLRPGVVGALQVGLPSRHRRERAAPGRPVSGARRRHVGAGCRGECRVGDRRRRRGACRLSTRCAADDGRSPPTSGEAMTTWGRIWHARGVSVASSACFRPHSRSNLLNYSRLMTRRGRP